MSNSAFDTEILNTLETILSGDWNLIGSYGTQSLREVLRHLSNVRVGGNDDTAIAPPLTSFMGEGLKIRPTNPVTYQVQITPGVGFFGDLALATDIGGIAGVNDQSTLKPMVVKTPQVIPLVPNGGPFQRIDLIEVRPERFFTDNVARSVLVNPSTGVFANTPVNKTFSWVLDGQIGQVVSPANNTAPIGYKVGIPAGVPVPPATSPGYVLLG